MNTRHVTGPPVVLRHRESETGDARVNTFSGPVVTVNRLKSRCAQRRDAITYNAQSIGRCRVRVASRPVGTDKRKPALTRCSHSRTVRRIPVGNEGPKVRPNLLSSLH